MPAHAARSALLLALLGGCAPDYSPDTYSGSAVQQASKVEQGVIVGVRQVGISAQGTTGLATGGAAGGIAGAQLPGSGVRTALTALGGSVIGGIVGTGIERVAGDTTAFEYIVRKANGELLSVTQKDAAALALGQRVLVIAGTQARIVADYTVPPEPPAPAPAVPAPVASAPAVPEPVTATDLPPPAAADPAAPY